LIIVPIITQSTFKMMNKIEQQPMSRKELNRSHAISVREQMRSILDKQDAITSKLQQLELEKSRFEYEDAQARIESMRQNTEQFVECGNCEIVAKYDMLSIEIRIGIRDFMSFSDFRVAAEKSVMKNYRGLTFVRNLIIKLFEFAEIVFKSPESLRAIDNFAALAISVEYFLYERDPKIFQKDDEVKEAHERIYNRLFPDAVSIFEDIYHIAEIQKSETRM
jgi:hypothetical protein